MLATRLTQRVRRPVHEYLPRNFELEKIVSASLLLGRVTADVWFRGISDRTVRTLWRSLQGSDLHSR